MQHNTRLTLTNLMGLDSNESPWSALDRLPLPVAEEDEAEALIAIAREKNLRIAGGTATGSGDAGFVQIDAQLALAWWF